jgi:hypothetical protein
VLPVFVEVVLLLGLVVCPGVAPAPLEAEGEAAAPAAPAPDPAWAAADLLDPGRAAPAPWSPAATLFVAWLLVELVPCVPACGEVPVGERPVEGEGGAAVLRPAPAEECELEPELELVLCAVWVVAPREVLPVAACPCPVALLVGCVAWPAEGWVPEERVAGCAWAAVWECAVGVLEGDLVVFGAV